jgi:hypothetical protein
MSYTGYTADSAESLFSGGFRARFLVTGGTIRV